MTKEQKINRHQNKEAIVILGGGLVKDKKTNKWQTISFDGGDDFGLDGSRLRVLAASTLFKKQNCTVITSGGQGQLKGQLGDLTLASIMKSELVDLGVPESAIIEENQSGNSYQQLLELQKIIKARGLKQLVIISNEYHLPRIEAMIKHGPKLDTLKSMLAAEEIKLQVAEEILINDKPQDWQEEINTVYKSEAMKKRLDLEHQGVKDIKTGTYKF